MNNFFISRNFIFRNGVGKKAMRKAESTTLQKFNTMEAPKAPKPTPEQTKEELAKQRQKALRLLRSGKLSSEQAKKLREKLTGGKDLVTELKKIAAGRELKEMQQRLPETQKEFYEKRDKAIELAKVYETNKNIFVQNQASFEVMKKSDTVPQHPRTKPRKAVSLIHAMSLKEQINTDNLDNWYRDIRDQFFNYKKSYDQFKDMHFDAAGAQRRLAELERDMWHAEELLELKTGRGPTAPDPEKVKLPTNEQMGNAIREMVILGAYAERVLHIRGAKTGF